MSSERYLWSAVLGQAVEDLTDTRTAAQVFDSTRLWFASDNYEPGSFLWICDQLDLNAVSIRRRVFENAESGAPLPERASRTWVQLSAS